MHFAQQKSDLCFVDITADGVNVNPGELKTKIILLGTIQKDGTQKLYFTDLAHTGKQILHCIYTITPQKNRSVVRISYDNGMINIIYTSDTHGLTNGECEQLNDKFFPLLYACHELAKDECITPDNDYDQTVIKPFLWQKYIMCTGCSLTALFVGWLCYRYC